MCRYREQPRIMIKNELKIHASTKNGKQKIKNTYTINIHTAHTCTHIQTYIHTYVRTRVNTEDWEIFVMKKFSAITSNNKN